MSEPYKRSVFKNPLFYGLVAFFFVFIITQFIAFQKHELYQKTELQIVNERVSKLKIDLQNVLGQSYNVTQTLAFIVDQYGLPNNFDSIAQILLNSNNSVDALELVNAEGVITHVYPIKGNEVLGMNVLNDPDNKFGAKITLEKGDYYTAGPIYLKQGGSGVIGRRPMYKNGEFNGFVAAVVRLSTIINAVQLDSLEQTKFSYKLVKINTDNSEETFYTSKNSSQEGAIGVPLTTSQGEWKLYVYSNNTQSNSGAILFAVLGLLLSIVCGVLSWFLMRQPAKLNKLVDEKTALLKDSKERYRLLIEGASDGIFLIDFQGNIVDANPYGLEMLGYDKELLLTKNLIDITIPEDTKKNPRRYKEMREGQTIRSERRLVKKDGTVFYVEVSAKKINDTTILGIVRDISERKELELAAKENLARFGKAYNNRFVGMVIKDHNSCVVDANFYFLNLIGYSLDEIKGKTLGEIGLINFSPALDTNPGQKSVIESEGVDKAELDFTNKKGETLHLITSAEPYNYLGEKYSLSTFIDQTEAKRANLAILESERKYKQFTERISDAFVAFDQNWCFTDINIKAAKLVGMNPTEMLGKNVWDEYPEFKNSDAYSAFKKAMVDQVYTHFEQYHPKADLWVENHLYPSPNGLSVYFKDITYRKKVEQEKQQLISIIENSPGFIGLATLKGESVFMNDAGKRMIDLPVDFDIKNSTIFDFFEDEYRDVITNEHMPIIMEKGLWSGEVPLKNFKTKKTTPFEFSGFLIRDKKTDQPIAIGAIGFDLTERKKNQKEILVLQGKMDAAIRIGKIGYWDFDLETKSFICSPLMYTIYDIDQDTVLTIPYLESIIHPEDLEKHRQNLADIIKEKCNHNFTYRIIVRDGSIKYVMVEVEVLRDSNNKPLIFRGTVIDITKQKEAEVEILDLQSKMNAAIRIGNIGYWHWDMNSARVEWSKEMYAIHEITPNTPMTPELVRKIIYHEDVLVLDTKLAEKKGEGMATPSNYRIQLKDNSFKYFLAFSEIIYDENGEPTVYHGTAMDITKSVISELALKESQEKFSKAFHTNLMGMLILDKQRRVIDANEMVYSILETSKKKLLGKTVLESQEIFINENERRRVWEKLIEEGEILNEEYKIQLKSGLKKTLLLSITPFQLKGEVSYLVNIFDDSKRKEAESNLETQFHELQKTNSELDSFVYSASHELRAPLSSVLGLINLIQLEDIDPKLFQHLNMMERSIERLDDFIKDIIEYSRNKHLKVELETINFTTLIKHCLESFWYLENTDKINIEVHISDSKSFVSDSKRISVLLNNFISNAIKYHDLDKESPSIWINIKTNNKEATIVIKDNGVGMAEDQLERIFEMFYRVSSKVMGSGIGLFIVKEVITKLKGTIEATSNIGEGSTFTIRIPNESGRL
ncbi:PAS domain S-box protein [Maribacter sp. IgM3_T14_3]|uniref:PAS domain S-box protein n=1 Tax=Maribacter sp. IgM3_T14_3 TaxID=3415140 RepID=UPI003C6F70FE